MRKQNRKVNIKTMAYNMGEKIVAQNEKFCELYQGLKSSDNVLPIINLEYVPSPEKEIAKNIVLKEQKMKVVLRESNSK